MSVFNVGTVTFEVLINSEDFDSSVKELEERLSTHPTVIEAVATVKTFNMDLISVVESGNYKKGDMFKEEYRIYLNSFGDFDFTTIVKDS